MAWWPRPATLLGVAVACAAARATTAYTVSGDFLLHGLGMCAYDGVLLSNYYRDNIRMLECEDECRQRVECVAITVLTTKSNVPRCYMHGTQLDTFTLEAQSWTHWGEEANNEHDDFYRASFDVVDTDVINSLATDATVHLWFIQPGTVRCIEKLTPITSTSSPTSTLTSTGTTSVSSFLPGEDIVEIPVVKPSSANPAPARAAAAADLPSAAFVPAATTARATVEVAEEGGAGLSTLDASLLASGVGLSLFALNFVRQSISSVSGPGRGALLQGMQNVARAYWKKPASVFRWDFSSADSSKRVDGFASLL